MFGSDSLFRSSWLMMRPGVLLWAPSHAVMVIPSAKYMNFQCYALSWSEGTAQLANQSGRRVTTMTFFKGLRTREATQSHKKEDYAMWENLGHLIRRCEKELLKEFELCLGDCSKESKKWRFSLHWWYQETGINCIIGYINQSYLEKRQIRVLLKP